MNAQADPGENVRRALARLAVSGKDWRDPRGGGIPELTAADIAGAVGYVDGVAAQYLVLYLWAGHDTLRDRQRLCLYLAGEASRWAREEGWKDGKPGELQRLAGMALDEMADASDYVCRTCSGSGGITLPNGKPAICSACGGVGRHWRGERLNASRWGCTREVWRSRYAAVYRRMVAMLSEMESLALGQIARALWATAQVNVS
jgi:hypothetical protein